MTVCETLVDESVVDEEGKGKKELQTLLLPKLITFIFVLLPSESPYIV